MFLYSSSVATLTDSEMERMDDRTTRNARPSECDVMRLALTRHSGQRDPLRTIVIMQCEDAKD